MLNDLVIGFQHIDRRQAFIKHCNEWRSSQGGGAGGGAGGGTGGGIEFDARVLSKMWPIKPALMDFSRLPQEISQQMHMLEGKKCPL